MTLFFPDTPIPVFMSWPVPSTGMSVRDWQQDRCAVCGSPGNLVLDHDHDTGLRRGYLCRPCNMLESSGEHPAWKLWQAGMNPARLLGQDTYYRGKPRPRLRKVHDMAAIAAAVAVLDDGA